MTDTPPDLRFLASHEWIRLDQETKIATVGISNFAQEQLGDVVYVELPEVGAVLISGDEVAVVESVKATSEVYAPISGEVVEINNALEQDPNLINDSPYDGGWFFKVKVEEDHQENIDSLMTTENYLQRLEEIKLSMSQKKNFLDRHLGITDNHQKDMLSMLGYETLESLIESVVPKSILEKDPLNVGDGMTELEALKELDKIAKENKVFRSFIGQGYYGTITPKVIKRNVLENPSWYTSYTPYQAEVSQGRLEALINFQTTITELTGMGASASLLMEAAAAEAMTLAKRLAKNKSDTFFVDENCFEQTINVLQTRAKPLGIKILLGSPEACMHEEFFGILLQYPNKMGCIEDYSAISHYCKKQKNPAFMCNRFISINIT